MISWAVTFLIIALIAAVLGFSGVAGTAVNLAWICAVIGIVLALIAAMLWLARLTGRSNPRLALQRFEYLCGYALGLPASFWFFQRLQVFWMR